MSVITPPATEALNTTLSVLPPKSVVEVSSKTTLALLKLTLTVPNL